MKGLLILLFTFVSLNGFAQQLEANIYKQFDKVHNSLSQGGARVLSQYEQEQVLARLDELVVLLRADQTVVTPQPQPQPGTPAGNRLAAGMQVLHGNSIRVVEAVGTDSVVLRGTYTHNQLTVRRSQVTMVVQGHGGFTVNATVLFGQQIRQIEALDNTGRIVLKATYTHNQTFVTSRDVSLVVGSHMGFRAGDRVIYGGTIREVQHVGHTGRLALKGTYTHNPVIVNIGDVEKVQ
jgi:hypothetical protein